jgi:hypothetical protein
LGRESFLHETGRASTRADLTPGSRVATRTNEFGIRGRPDITEAHDVPNLFVCDGSSLVTSGRGQPTMTIQALAFRAGEHIARFAKRGEI